MRRKTFPFVYKSEIEKMNDSALRTKIVDRGEKHA